MKLQPYDGWTPTPADIANNQQAVAQSQAVDQALQQLQQTDPASFEKIRRLPFSEQAKHFGL